MALGKMCIMLVIMLVQMFWAGVDAQSNCPMALTTLTPCLSVSVGNSSNPSSSCCSELANLVQTAPLCLCNVLSNNIVGAQALGSILNQTLPSSLPGACNVQVPPMDQCGGQGYQSAQGNEGAYSEGSMLQMSLLVILLPILSSCIYSIFH